MSTVNEKMTALADEVRALSGTATKKGIDAMTTDVNAANTEIIEQADLIAQITTALEGKAGGGGDNGSSIETCTVHIINKVGGYLHCYGATCYNNGQINIFVGGEHVGNETHVNNITIENVVCGSFLYVRTTPVIIPAYSVTNGSEVYTDDFLNGWYIKVTTSPNVTETITLWDDD